MKLGKAVKLVRTASGLKQKQIASRLGVTSNYVSLVESDRREPSVAFLRGLAEVLNVPIGLFFLWDEGNLKRPHKDIEQIRDLLAQLEAMHVSSRRKKAVRR
jgi:transcriptional regulator with XRE-family HTH domain